MAEMGRYCKAYLANAFREFPNWKPDEGNLRVDKEIEDGQEVEKKRSGLQEDDVLYLQENFVVTDGVFKDENIVYDDTSEEWRAFCTSVLGFEIPDYIHAMEEEDRKAAAEAVDVESVEAGEPQNPDENTDPGRDD